MNEKTRAQENHKCKTNKKKKIGKNKIKNCHPPSSTYIPLSLVNHLHIFLLSPTYNFFPTIILQKTHVICLVLTGVLIFCHKKVETCGRLHGTNLNNLSLTIAETRVFNIKCSKGSKPLQVRKKYEVYQFEALACHGTRRTLSI